MAAHAVSAPADEARALALGTHLIAAKIMPKIDLLTRLDRADWPRIGVVGAYPDAYRYGERGEKIAAPSVTVEVDGKLQVFGGAKTVAEVVGRVNVALGKPVAEKKMQFEVRGRAGSYSINKKGDSERRALKSFETSKEAFSHIEDRYDDLVAAWDGVKERDNVKESDVRGDENRPRSAQDWRQGKDITAEEFQEKFGFRGGEFGNWVSQGKNAKERQWMLNEAHDALMDLADIVGVPPKAISLNGSLGVAFGARGSGSASAHFEPVDVIINLTKTRGAGTLAHEWFHALDNYFSRMRGGEVKRATGAIGNPLKSYRENNYITYKPEPLMVHKSGRYAPMTRARLDNLHRQDPGSSYVNPDNWTVDPSHKAGVRPEVEQSFVALVDALNASPMTARAKKNDKGEDGYWSRIIERGARSFENYVIHKMAEQGYHNDYLANVRPIEEFPRSQERYPYLVGEEIKPVAEAFDKLFETVETKQTDSGVAMFHTGSPITVESITAKDFDAVVARLTDGWNAVSRYRIVPVDDYADIPGPVLAAAEDLGYPVEQIKGFVYQGHAYLVRQNLADAAEVEETLTHEAIGHLGVMALLGKDFTPILNDFWLRMGGTSGVLKVARQYGIEKEVSGYADDLMGVDSLTRIQKQAKIVDELIAHASTTGEMHKAVRVFLGRAKAALHRWAVKHGWSWLAKQLGNFSDWDMAVFLQHAKSAIVTGKLPEGGDIAFSVASAQMRAGRLFHSTASEKAGAAILQSGMIVAPDLPHSRGKLTPVVGRAYASPSLETASIYSLGGVMMGHEYDWQSRGDRAAGRYGYVFEVDTQRLGDVQPDEDSVGELAANAMQGKQAGLEWLAHMARTYGTDRQIKNVIDGLYADYAQLGKKLVKKMTDAQKTVLMDEYGAHVANAGPLQIIRAWKVDKSRAKEIARDGANVLDVGELVFEHEETEHEAMFNAKSGSWGNPLDTAALDVVIDRVTARSPSHFSRDTVVTAPLFADLPPPILAKAKNEGYDAHGRKTNGEKLTGVSYDGKVYLVQENISSELEAEETLLHERLHQIVHGNAKDPSGIALRQALGKLYIRLGAKSGIVKLAAESGIDITGPLAAFQKVSAANRNAFLAEEFLAHAEGQRAYEKLPTEIRRVAREFWGEFRDWLRASKFVRIADALGAKLDDFTQADLAWTLKGIRQQDAGTESTAIRFMTSWHGSPHDHDKFDMSKVGTGEGGQAYGWGLYFAGAKSVAEWYRKQLSEGGWYSRSEFDRLHLRALERTEIFSKKTDRDGVIHALEIAGDDAKSINRKDVFDEIIYDAGDIDIIVSANNIRSEIRNVYDAAFSGRWKGFSQKERDRIVAETNIADETLTKTLFEIIGKHINKGKLYQVELAPTQDEYLDWDKPLSEQSEVVRSAVIVALERNGIIETSAVDGGYSASYDFYGMTVIPKVFYSEAIAKNAAVNEWVKKNGIASGAKLYHYLSNTFGSSDKAASIYLHSIGIRGIRYLDGSSRSAGEGNSNYVIFDDADIEIVSKESRAKPEKPSLKQTAIQGVADRFKKQFKGAAALDIRVVKSRDQIPARYKPSPYAEGTYHTADGVIYLIADNMPSVGRAWQVMMHEAVGHYGMANMMGEKFADLWKTVLDKGTSGAELLDHPGVGDKNYATVEAVRMLYPEASDHVVAQEVLARMAEVTNPPTWAQAALAKVRIWLRGMFKAAGFDIQPSMKDAKDLVTLASHHLRTGKNLNGGAVASGEAFASQKIDVNVVDMDDKNSVAGTQAPTSSGDVATGSAKHPHVATAEQVLAAIEEDAYAEYGLRVIPGEFEGEISAGDTLPNSKVWADGNETESTLGGTSAASIRRNDLASVVRAIKDLGASGKNGDNGYYYGDRVVLIKGDAVGHGEDAGERIFANAKVVGIWKKPTKGLSEVQPNEQSTSAGSGASLESRSHISGDSGKAYTPEQLAAYKNVGRTVETPTAKERVTQMLDGTGKKIVQGMADQFAPLKYLDKLSYLLSRMSRGTDGALEAMLMYGKIKTVDGIYDVDVKEGGVIDKLLTPLGKEADDFMWWIAANRAEGLMKESELARSRGFSMLERADDVDRLASKKEFDAKQLLQQAGNFPKNITGNQNAQKQNAKDANALLAEVKSLHSEAKKLREEGNALKRVSKENLFSKDDIAALKSLGTGQLDFDYKLPSGKTTRNRSLAYLHAKGVLADFNKSVMDIAEKAGLIDGAERALWEKEFYVPFYREVEEGRAFPSVKSGLVRQYAFKQLKGGTDQLNHDLLANTIMNWSHLLSAAAKNNAATAALSAAEDAGIAEKIPGAAKGSVSVKVNGKDVHYRVDDRSHNALKTKGLRPIKADTLMAA